MPIQTLRSIAGDRFPLDVRDADRIDDLRVLMDAGLIAALKVREPGGAGEPIFRVLAVTPSGPRLLDRMATSTSTSAGAVSRTEDRAKLIERLQGLARAEFDATAASGWQRLDADMKDGAKKPDP